MRFANVLNRFIRLLLSTFIAFELEYIRSAGLIRVHSTNYIQQIICVRTKYIKRRASERAFMSMRWATVKKVGHTKTTDVWIVFDVLFVIFVLCFLVVVAFGVCFVYFCFLHDVPFTCIAIHQGCKRQIAHVRQSKTLQCLCNGRYFRFSRKFSQNKTIGRWKSSIRFLCVRRVWCWRWRWRRPRRHKTNERRRWTLK